MAHYMTLVLQCSTMLTLNDITGIHNLQLMALKEANKALDKLWNYCRIVVICSTLSSLHNHKVCINCAVAAQQ